MNLCACLQLVVERAQIPAQRLTHAKARASWPLWLRRGVTLRKAIGKRLPTTGVGDRSQIVLGWGRASWSVDAGCCVFVLLFLAAMRIRRRGIWQWHGEKLWQVAWRVFCFWVWPASHQVGARASLCVCSVVLSFAPRLFQLFRLLPTLSGSSLPCSGMVERACLVARALVLTSDGSSAPATGLLGVGSQPMWR